jgi:hypothetical protein
MCHYTSFISTNGLSLKSPSFICHPFSFTQCFLSPCPKECLTFGGVSCFSWSLGNLLQLLGHMKCFQPAHDMQILLGKACSLCYRKLLILHIQFNQSINNLFKVPTIILRPLQEIWRLTLYKDYLYLLLS